MKKCNRENKENICCCYCEYVQNCTVSCISAENFTCDNCNDVVIEGVGGLNGQSN